MRQEIIATERTYVDGLLLLFNNFVEPLKVGTHGLRATTTMRDFVPCLSSPPPLTLVCLAFLHVVVTPGGAALAFGRDLCVRLTVLYSFLLASPRLRTPSPRASG